jgi:hypothetical protein
MKDTLNSQKTPAVPSYLSWFFPYKKRSLPISTKSPAAYYIFQNKFSITFINWLFQGMRGMGIADLIGKIILEIIFIALFLLISKNAILISFVGAHTLNWMVNTHFWDFGRFLGISRTSPDRFLPYLRKLKNRVNKDGSLPIAIIIGGFSRNREFKTTSDVDLIFIRGKGFMNSLTAVLITIRERFISFIYKFPLHLELYDSMETMKKHRDDEVPVVLKDMDGEAEGWYKEKGRGITDLDYYSI